MEINCIECSFNFKFPVKVGVEQSIVNAHTGHGSV
jgi:hypothetical protein